jgi:hypothetical protein
MKQFWFDLKDFFKNFKFSQPDIEKDIAFARFLRSIKPLVFSLVAISIANYIIADND